MTPTNDAIDAMIMMDKRWDTALEAIDELKYAPTLERICLHYRAYRLGPHRPGRVFESVPVAGREFLASLHSAKIFF